jgi:hypothetical protein
LKTGDKVAASVVLCVARRSLGRGSHSVKVVLADKDSGLYVFKRRYQALRRSGLKRA